MKLHDRVIVVTGATGGIGRGIAHALLDDGARVVLTDLDESRLETVSVALDADRTRSLGVAADLSSESDIERVVTATMECFGAVDGLVNNAGAIVMDAAWDASLADWAMQLENNVTASFAIARAVGRELRKGNGGAIVNVASVAGRSSSLAMGCHYTASKAGLLGLTRHLARELAPRRIRVNAVCPGPIETALLDRGMDEAAKQRTLASVPLGRLGQPDDIARAIVFLASDDAGFITGAALDANGGVFMA